MKIYKVKLYIGDKMVAPVEVYAENVQELMEKFLGKPAFSFDSEQKWTRIEIDHELNLGYSIKIS